MLLLLLYALPLAWPFLALAALLTLGRSRESYESYGVFAGYALARPDVLVRRELRVSGPRYRADYCGHRIEADGLAAFIAAIEAVEAVEAVDDALPPEPDTAAIVRPYLRAGGAA